MRCPPATRLAAVGVALALGWAVACGRNGPAPAVARSTGERALGRAYDGAPPTIPHDSAIGACVTCHDNDGTVIDGVGIAPASPHGDDAASGAISGVANATCPRKGAMLLVASRFTGLPQGAVEGNGPRQARLRPSPHDPAARTVRACHAVRPLASR